MPDATWAKKALDECSSGAWTSKYKIEIQALLGKCHIDPSMRPSEITKAMSKFSQQTEISKIKTQRDHSLKYFPSYPSGMGRQEYINFSEESSTISKFRLGNADLGNRDSPPIIICPACNNGPKVLGHNLDSHNLYSRNLDPYNLDSHNLDLPQPSPDIT